eukprot:8208916-Prorocentrum_lima.AAC.1
MTSSLVGSEMCIRDSAEGGVHVTRLQRLNPVRTTHPNCCQLQHMRAQDPVSYTHLTLPTICSV